MIKKINILFTAILSNGSTGFELFKAFKNNKNIKIDSLFNDTKSTLFKKNTIIARILWKLKLPYDEVDLNTKLLNYDLSNIDILFTIKGNTIRPSTLKNIKIKYPNLKLISWSQDDMYAWHNRSIYYTFGLKYYDLVITQKSYNISELKQLGAKKVLFQNKAYSKYLHKRHTCNQYIYDIIFIGDYEDDRFNKMLFLANHGLKINIFGPNWDRKIKIKHDNLIFSKPIIGEKYSEILSCSKISLCFLKKANRDLQTSRSMEIPACGGFMVAERTDEHKQLFEEDNEAVYFDTQEELLEKVKYYLEYEEERKKIAEAGYRKTREAGYSYDDRVEEMIKAINEI